MVPVISKHDKNILQELGKQVAEIAALPAQEETRGLWKALNALKPVRPMVLIDQIPWHEMDVDGELALQCEDDFLKKLETKLRRTLYSWRHMRADMVVESFIEVHKVICGADLGIKVMEQRAMTDSHNDIVGHFYIDQLQSEEDLYKIKASEVYLDEKATSEVREKATEVFDGILTVHMQGLFPNFAAWDRIAEYRSVQNILFDLADRPEFLHQTISKFTGESLSMLDQLEEKGLLGCRQTEIHCSAAYSDELPAPGFDPNCPRARDLWTYGMAQLFSTVSPAMHNEFEMDYALKWYERFGMVNYGCCEPLHNKMDMVRRIPNVRKVSMSPWVDVEKGAREIGRDYVFSRKPSPAFLSFDAWEPEICYKDMLDTLKKCSRYGCTTEFILKDISTVRYQPQRLWEWADAAVKLLKA